MKERFSNVLAWLGFGIMVLNIQWGYVVYGHLDGSFWGALGCYGFLAVFNYLMVGRFRLLPWKKITEDS